MDGLKRAVLSVGYIGYMPVASGTWGSLPGVALAWWLRDEPYLAGTVIVLLFGLGMVWGDDGRRFWGKSDAGQIVLDEVVGQMITLILFPMTVKVMVLGFLLFRVFDIAKLPPARQLERLHGGLGVMADDVAAGVMAHAVLWGIVHWTGA